MSITSAAPTRPCLGRVGAALVIIFGTVIITLEKNYRSWKKTSFFSKKQEKTPFFYFLKFQKYYDHSIITVATYYSLINLQLYHFLSYPLNSLCL